MITFELSDVDRIARWIDGAAEQMPFAIAGALNDAADLARERIISDTWPSHVGVRDRNFIGAALTTKGERATKRNLRVSIYDRLGRASLSLHEHGGTKKAKRLLALPERKIKGRRGAKGMPKGLRPSALPNSFRKGDIIYQRTGRKGRSLKLMYTLAPSAPVKAEVPFHTDFERVMRREMPIQFKKRLRQALATRRR